MSTPEVTRLDTSKGKALRDADEVRSEQRPLLSLLDRNCLSRWFSLHLLSALKVAIIRLCFLLALSCLPLLAQRISAHFQEDATEVVFEHLNENTGLANPVIAAFAEDTDGFLWIGSQSGVQRWDGYRFWTYKTKLGDPTSLPDNLVSTLYNDLQGRLWIGTSSGGLARYDRALDRFVRYSNGRDSTSLVNIAGITGDGARGLWIIAANGLSHLDTDNGDLRQVSTQVGQNPSERVLSVLRSPDGVLWIGTDQGLERSVPFEQTRSDNDSRWSDRRFEQVALPASEDSSAAVATLFRDRAGRIWAGTQEGVFVLENANPDTGGGVRFLQARDAGDKPVSIKRVKSISQTAQGEIWVGTQDQGIFALNPGSDPGTWIARQIIHDTAMPDSLANNWVTAEYLGGGGIMWVGTERGVNYLDTTPKAAFTLSGGSVQNQLFNDADVYSILSRPDGSVWLGLSNNGINILNAEGHKVGEVRPQPGSTTAELPAHSLQQGTIPCLVEAGDGSVYICSQGGLYRTDPRGHDAAQKEGMGGGTNSIHITRVPIGPDAGIGMGSVMVEKGVLWIAGRNGLWEMNQDDRTGPAHRARLNRPLTDPRISTLLRGAGDLMWVGTQNGLNQVDLKTGAVENILPDASDASALGAGLIASLLIDRKGRLWVGTFSGGIDIMEGRDAQGRPRFHRIIDGLPNENIDTLLEANDGSIWASTDGGVARIDPDTYNITVLLRAEGALLPAYWNSVGAVTAAGEMLFGGTGGLTVVRPSLAKTRTYQPPVVVTHARIGLYDVPTSRFNSGLNEYPVWIPPDHNDLTVEFTALDYSAPERNRYAYKLDGFDRDWIPVDSTRRVARYTNLPPGNYVLLLSGSNRDGVWAPLRKIRIHVIPAWYQTVWFAVLAVIASLVVLFGLFLLATAYLRRQQRELERQVARRTAELHRMTVELQDSQQKLEHMAYTDSLTNLPNRRMFTEHFKQIIAMKLRWGGSFALLLIDFDRFKEINDTFGHDAGDAVLRELSVRLAAIVRASDCFARLGGDEFGLLLAEAPDGDGLNTVCRKILESFEAPVLFDGIELKTTPSIGLALFPDAGETQDELYKAADQALYQAKRDGGNGCSWQRAALNRI